MSLVGAASDYVVDEHGRRYDFLARNGRNLISMEITCHRFLGSLIESMGE